MRFVGALVAAVGLSLVAVNPVSASDPWVRLHRPMHLPTVAPGASCPVSAASSFNFRRYGVSRGIGKGPAYPVGFAQPGSVLSFSRDVSGGEWNSAKVLWFVAPSYRGRVLIRGGRLDAPGTVRFDGGIDPASELRIKIGFRGGNPGRAWVGQRYRPSSTRLRDAGCYAYQIDGTTFSRVVIFAAVDGGS